MDDLKDTLAAAKSSVQDPVFEKERVYAPGGGLWLIGGVHDDTLLPAWGSPRRDWELRRYSRAMYNTLFMGAVNNLANEIASTPWQLYGKRNKDYYQKLLLNAEFGAGWRTFIKKLVYAYCVYDSGMYVEVIARGDPLKAVAGRVEGIATLDPLYCEVTGNIQYPVIFRSQTGYHRLHTTRVRRFVDNPQVDRDFYGKGLSALSRYFGFMYAQILMGRYNVERLSDLPPAGIAILNNLPRFQDIIAQYEADRRKDGQSIFRNIMQAESFDPSEKASIEFVSFSQLPEQFDYDTRMRHDYNLVALSIGVDPQDVAPLSGQGLGSGQQSFVLDSKAKRKTPAILLAEIKTFINTDVLPAYLEMDFTPSDEEGAKQEADTAQAWVNVANSASQLTDEQKVQLLANKVQAIQDVVTDKQGNILFNDTDTPDSTEQDTGADVALDDTTTPGTDTDEEAAPPVTTDEQVELRLRPSERRKSYSSTRGDFEERVALIIDASVSGDAGRIRAGVDMRAALADYGQRAMLDGLSDGGTQLDALEGDDLKTFNTWRAEQSAYVATLMTDIFKDGAEPNGAARARIWANKSLNTIYQKGLLSADANGFYEWVYGGTVKHCSTCAKNVGLIMRLKQWHAKDCLPQGDCLECGGFNCLCKLKRRRKKALYLPTVYRYAA